MFTGIVTALGSVTTVTDRSGSRILQIDSPYDDLVVGESIAVDGVCLTVEALLRSGAFQVAAGEETIRMTTLRGRAPGDRVHLERALRPVDRMGGHFVQGHVDGISTVVSIRPGTEYTRIDLSAPAELMRYIAPKGSVCLDGVSLTVNGIERNTFWVGLVPHTLRVTKMGVLRTGDSVNLETDLIARYLERLGGP